MLIPHHSPRRSAPFTPAMGSPTRPNPGSNRQGRDQQQERWVGTCTTRLMELRPAEDESFLTTIAEDMWHDVGSFDPAIAAEMEHESWPE